MGGSNSLTFHPMVFRTTDLLLLNLKFSAIMEVTVIMEKTEDGHYSCYVEEDLPGFGLSGYGDTAEDAREDMLAAYKEIRDMQKEEGKGVPDLHFTFKNNA